MAATSFDAIFDELKKDFIKLSKDAAKKAAIKAQPDIEEKADQFIDEYYDYKPKRYKRKYALYNLIQQYYKESETSDGILITFGIEYVPSKIKGVHRSNSWYHQSGDKWRSVTQIGGGGLSQSQDNGIPEPEWITERFLAGEHPWGQTDSQSPDDKMQEFFDAELENLVAGYASSALFDAISTYF